MIQVWMNGEVDIQLVGTGSRANAVRRGEVIKDLIQFLVSPSRPVSFAVVFLVAGRAEPMADLRL